MPVRESRTYDTRVNHRCELCSALAKAYDR